MLREFFAFSMTDVVTRSHDRYPCPTRKQIDDDDESDPGENAYSDAMRGIAPKRGRGAANTSRANGSNSNSNKRANTNTNMSATMADGRRRPNESRGAGSSGTRDGVGDRRGGGGAGGDGGGGSTPLCPGHNEECALRTVRKEVRLLAPASSISCCHRSAQPVGTDSDDAAIAWIYFFVRLIIEGSLLVV